MSAADGGCPKCGAATAAGVRYCPSCGAALYLEESVPPTPLRVVAGVVLILVAAALGSVGACFGLLAFSEGFDTGPDSVRMILIFGGVGLASLLLLLGGIRLLLRRTVRRPVE